MRGGQSKSDSKSQITQAAPRRMGNKVGSRAISMAGSSQDAEQFQQDQQAERNAKDPEQKEAHCRSPGS